MLIYIYLHDKIVLISHRCCLFVILTIPLLFTIDLLGMKMLSKCFDHNLFHDIIHLHINFKMAMGKYIVIVYI